MAYRTTHGGRLAEEHNHQLKGVARTLTTSKPLWEAQNQESHSIPNQNRMVQLHTGESDQTNGKYSTKPLQPHGLKEDRIQMDGGNYQKTDGHFMGHVATCNSVLHNDETNHHTKLLIGEADLAIRQEFALGKKKLLRPDRFLLRSKKTVLAGTLVDKLRWLASTSGARATWEAKQVETPTYDHE